jgi:hypothetical protein
VVQQVREVLKTERAYGHAASHDAADSADSAEDLQCVQHMQSEKHSLHLWQLGLLTVNSNTDLNVKMPTGPNCSGALANNCRRCSGTVPTTATSVALHVTENTSLEGPTCCDLGVNMPTDPNCSGALADNCRLCSGTVPTTATATVMHVTAIQRYAASEPRCQHACRPESAVARWPATAGCAVAYSPTTATAKVMHATIPRGMTGAGRYTHISSQPAHVRTCTCALLLRVNETKKLLHGYVFKVFSAQLLTCMKPSDCFRGHRHLSAVATSSSRLSLRLAEHCERNHVKRMLTHAISMPRKLKQTSSQSLSELR